MKVTFYENGEAFLKEHEEWLSENVDETAFAVLDAKDLPKCDDEEYILVVEKDGKRALALSKKPFKVILYGDPELTDDLLDALRENGKKIIGFVANVSFGPSIISYYAKLGIEYVQGIRMDFMSCQAMGEASDPEVVSASEEDIDELTDCLGRFLIDCGLLDEQITKEDVTKGLSLYRIIKENGKIVSVGKVWYPRPEAGRICDIYTDPSYRGRGLARKMVNALRNNIIAQGKLATITVDHVNPISNHLYASLGFVKSFATAFYLERK